MECETTLLARWRLLLLLTAIGGVLLVAGCGGDGCWSDPVSGICQTGGNCSTADCTTGSGGAGTYFHGWDACGGACSFTAWADCPGGGVVYCSGGAVASAQDGVGVYCGAGGGDYC